MSATVPQYPWSEGEPLFASALNVAIASAGGPSGAGGAVNVLDPAYGADPTGVADSTTAIRNAITTGRVIYLPTGVYKVTDILVLNNRQLMYGDGRGVSRLIVPATFNLSALGVVQLATSETGAAIRDFSIEMAQPDTNARASLVAYPPAIYAQNAGRFQIERVRVYGAKTGLDARGNAGGAFIDFLEVSAFDYGMRWEGALDVVHCDNYHFWPFGVTTNQLAIIKDGVTVAAEIGKVDGFAATNFFTFAGKVNFLHSPFTVQGWFEISNMLLDSDHACLQIDDCNWGHIVNLYTSSSGSAANAPSIAVNGGGLVRVTNFELNQGSIAAPVQVTGGTLSLNNGRVRKGANKNGVATVSGGLLTVDGVECNSDGTGALGNPLFAQSGTGILRLSNCYYRGTVTSGVAASFASDDPGNMVSNFGYGPLSLDVPASVKANGPAASRYGVPLTGLLTSGDVFNTAYGVNALAAGIAGSASNTVFGNNTGAAITTGNSNDLFGRGAGQSITTGTTNALFGRLAGSGITTASNNVLFGFGAMQTGTGASNTAFGRQAGAGISTGNFNTIFGHQVGLNGGIGAGQHNILIGTNNLIDVAPTNSSHTFRFGGAGGVTFFAQGLDTLTPAWTFLGTVNFNTINSSASMSINSTTIRSGTGAATGTQPAGSLWLRTDGATGTRIYVSSGGGTWLPIAGV